LTGAVLSVSARENAVRDGRFEQGAEKQASGRQPRRAALWKAPPIQEVGEHLQKPYNAGSRPQAQLFNALLKRRR
jgi:hypothetical protein